MRCHGKKLCPTMEVGGLPPQRGMLLTEQHHPYFSRMTPGMAACCKCNHDLSVLLRLPAPEPRTPKPDDADHAEDDDSTDEALAEQMAAEITDATYYITEYAGKVQPQLDSLFVLLERGQRRLEEQFDEDPTLPKKGPAYRAARTLFRMMFSCQKRVHKSMQEMVSYLLGFPEAYSTHEFRPLYYANIVAMAEAMFPDRDNTVGLERITPEDVVATVVPPPSPKRRG